MKIEEQIKLKLDEAIDILKKFGMPSAQQNERTAYCLLSLLNVTPEKRMGKCRKSACWNYTDDDFCERLLQQGICTKHS
ncbi:hypothetical protein [Treponema vincentii]|uniref:hypothetical protein n=1 Tax=Treponema vincentii TaxID=69710 RepID=UPI001E550808|nr:hypothetical protein [Treponema vincentii]